MAFAMKGGGSQGVLECHIRGSVRSGSGLSPEGSNFSKFKKSSFELSNTFHICRIQLQKKKSGVKKCLEILPLRGGGADP